MLRPEAAPGPVSRADDPRIDAVMAELDDVFDPELDEPVTQMGFIGGVVIQGGAVDVEFRLPTYWCSANFAFLMATDMRLAVERLPWVTVATIRLVDHFAAPKINRGVAARQGFAEVFSGEARTNLEEIRRVFREKAFLGRQERLMRLLVGRWGVEAALACTIADLQALARHDDGEVRGFALRYLAMRLHDGGDAEAGSPAFTTLDGVAVTPAGYGTHLRTLRHVRGAAEANAAMCRIYLEARTSHPVTGQTPADFEEPHADN